MIRAAIKRVGDLNFVVFATSLALTAIGLLTLLYPPTYIIPPLIAYLFIVSGAITFFVPFVPMTQDKIHVSAVALSAGTVFTRSIFLLVDAGFSAFNAAATTTQIAITISVFQQMLLALLLLMFWMQYWEWRKARGH